MANETMIDYGGPVLAKAKIVLSFRGAGWTSGILSAADASQAFVAVLSSPYLSHFVQYRNIRRAEIIFTIEDDRNLGKLGPDPRESVAGNIWLIADEEIKSATRVALKPKPPEDHEEILYLAVVSQDPIPIVVEYPDTSGYHDTFYKD